MKLLLVNKYHYLKGGAERYYLDLSQQWRDRGAQVAHLAMAHPQNLPSLPGDRFVRQIDYRSRMGVSDRLRGALSAIYSREAAAAARAIAREERPDVAHLHNIYHQLSPSILGALDGEGVPIVQTLHDYKLVCPAYLLLTEGEVCERCRGGRYHEALRHRCLLGSRAASLAGMVEAYLHRWLRSYEKVRLFLCPSRFLLEKLVTFGIARERLEHLPYFLPIERYRPAPGDGRSYVYAGRLSREKGVATLLEAHARVPAPRPALRILGEGPIRPQLEERARSLKLDDVFFEGHQPPERLARAVAEARFVAVPSEWYENYPYAILEAFALARPVVGARIGGIPELVRDGETGWTVPAGDAGALAAAIAEAASDRAACDRMGEAAREWIASTLDPASHMERLEGIYRRVRP